MINVGRYAWGAFNKGRKGVALAFVTSVLGCTDSGAGLSRQSALLRRLSAVGLYNGGADGQRVWDEVCR